MPTETDGSPCLYIPDALINYGKHANSLDDRTPFRGKQSIAGCMLAHQAVRQQGCVVGGLPVHQPTSVFKVVLTYALGRQFCQHIVQVVGVREAVAGQIGPKFCLVVNLVPHHRVRLACGAGRADGKDEASVPGHDQELEDLQRRSTTLKVSTPRAAARLSSLLCSNLPAFLVVGEVTVSREAPRAELLPRVGVLVGLVEVATETDVSAGIVKYCLV